MQTSGLILDVYDDYRGDVIRSLFPSRSEIPGLVKTAHALSGDERGQLPDDAFALVLRNGDEVLRKYACVDAGNTALSVMFFQKNGHKLPVEAQKVAAANLKVACDWYELPVQGLEKVALVGWAASKAVQHPWTVLQAAMAGPEMVHGVKENLRAVHEIERSRGDSFGGMPISPEQLAEHRKHAGVKETAKNWLVDRALGQPTAFGTKVKSTLADMATGSTDIKARIKDKLTDAALGIKKASMDPYVDVTNLEVKGEVTVKKASIYALNGQYPLDSYGQVKVASAYFEQYAREFQPEDRRTFCKALLKQAEALGIEVGDDVRHYGGEDFAPPDVLKVAHDSRTGLILDERQLVLLDALFEKAAELGPELFAETLAEFDKVAGLNYLYDKDLADPYYSTFYKEAEQEYSYIEGNDMVTEDALRALARSTRTTMLTQFSEDFVDEFCKDPVGIFKSMPRDQKKIIMRLANDTAGPSNQPTT